MTRKTRSQIETRGVHELVERLLETNETYDRIIAIVHEQTGQTLSRSALSRYRQQWVLAKLREETIGREIEALTTMLAAKPEVDLRQGAKALVLQKLVKALAQSEASFDRADGLDLAHLLLKLDRLEQLGAQTQLQRERLALMQQKAATAAEKTKDALAGAGVPPEQVTQLVDEILGVTA